MSNRSRPPAALLDEAADYPTHFSRVDSFIRADPEAMRQSLSWIATNDPKLIALGIDVLGRLAIRPADAEEARHHLLKVARERGAEAPGNIRWSIAHALGSLGNVLDGTSVDEDAALLLAQFCQDADADVRWQVAAGLGALLSPDTEPSSALVEALIELTRDPDAEIRSWATMAIGSQLVSDGETIRNTLLDRLHDDDIEVRGEAVVGLAARSDPRGRRVLAELLQREDVGNTPLEAVIAYGDREWLPFLEKLSASGWRQRDPIPTMLDDALRVCRDASR